MRIPVVLVVGAVFLAGCASQDADLAPAATPTPAPTPGGASSTPEPSPPTPAGERGPTEAGAPEEEKSFCESEETCRFWDEDYHEYVLYDVDATTLDVLIVPSASPESASDTQVIEAAILAWHDGIDQLGAPWLAQGLALHTYVLGRDAPPQEAIEDPEIIVLAAEYNPVLLFGIGLEPKQSACESLGQETVRAYPVHAHHGIEVRAADCLGAGFTCIAANTNFLLGTDIYLQDLVAHEFGHCLGGGHVGDALDFQAKRVPTHDIMSYQHDDQQVHCVSTLNLRVLEGLYAPLLGVDVETPLRAGDFHTMPRADYAQVACENPSG